MSKLRTVAMIPARMAASRFPGKPLIPILGLPMIEHVRRRMVAMIGKIPGLEEVWVATCDREVASVVEKAGGKVVMTSDKHERATDRIEEAAHKISADVYLNVQGDEPMVSQGQIEALIRPFQEDEHVQTACLVYPIKDLKDLPSLNVVKTVLSRSRKILYLSRSAIPGREINPAEFQYTKQSGLMGFRKNTLFLFKALESCPLEKKESVDLLRLLENDLHIQGVLYPEETLGVDVPEQVAIIENAIRSNPKQMALFESIR